MASNEECVPVKTIEELDPDFERPDTESRLWQGIVPPTRPFVPELTKLQPSILHQIGLTPVVKLNKIPASYGVVCDVYAKCEFLSPGGSVKDRIGYRMVLDAEEKNLIGPGSTIIEATSGNTGIGVALACAVRGYKCIIVMAEKNSNEKVDTLKLLGATIIRTPTEAGFLHPKGLFAVSQDLRRRIPNAVILGQYSNPGNYLAHYEGTGAELLWQFDNNLDMVVAGAGTGGTVSGIGKRVKEALPDCQIVSFDPYGSILARPEELNESNVHFFEVEGIGYDFIPTVLHHRNVDKWYKTADPESFAMARRLNREEGLLCGGSSGAAMHVAMLAAKELKAGQRCVVILPDGIRNYMTKFVNENWCKARGFMPLENLHGLWWWNDQVTNLNLPLVDSIDSTKTLQEVVGILNEKQTDFLPVTENGATIGIADRKLILEKVFEFGYPMDSSITMVLEKKFPKVSIATPLSQLAALLRTEPYACVAEDLPKVCGKERILVKGLITKADLLHYVAKGPQEKENKLTSQ